MILHLSLAAVSVEALRTAHLLEISLRVIIVGVLERLHERLLVLLAREIQTTILNYLLEVIDREVTARIGDLVRDLAVGEGESSVLVGGALLLLRSLLLLLDLGVAESLSVGVLDGALGADLSLGGAVHGTPGLLCFFAGALVGYVFTLLGVLGLGLVLSLSFGGVLSVLLGLLLVADGLAGDTVGLHLGAASVGVVVLLGGDAGCAVHEGVVALAAGGGGKEGVLVETTHVLGHLAEAPGADTLDLIVDLDVGESVGLDQQLVLEVMSVRVYTGGCQGIAYVIILPLLVAFPQQEVDVVSLSKTNTHNASGDGLLIVTDTTILGKPIGNLAITEATLTHAHHHLVVGVQLVRHALVVRRKALALAAVAATEGTRDTRRRLVEEVIVLVQDEGLAVVVRARHSEALNGLSLG
jgi:hypothetical protein